MSPKCQRGVSVMPLGWDGGWWVIPIIFNTKAIKINYIWYYYFILSIIHV